MLRAAYLFVFGIIVTIASLANSQETSVENALRLSRRTGKPIFAIASRKVCPPCQMLKSRVSQLFRNTNREDKVVYLRVDLDGPSWGKWSRMYPHQGRVIPIVYLIRADGQQLYGQSNTLPGTQLAKFIDQGVAHCGRSLTETQVERLEKNNQSLEKALQSNQILTAIQLVNEVSDVATPSKSSSYASSVVKFNKLADQIGQKAEGYLVRQLKQIEAFLDADDANRFRGVYEFVQLERSFGKFEALAKKLSPVAVKLAIDTDLREMWSAARRIHELNLVLASSNDAGKKQAALRGLEGIEKSEVHDEVKRAAREVIRRNGAVVASLNSLIQK